MNKRTFYTILSLLLILGATFTLMAPAKAQETSITVLNPETGNSIFAFSTISTTVGDRFNATVWACEVSEEAFLYQIHMKIDDTLLNITRAWHPTWDSDWIFYGRSAMLLGPVFYDIDGDGSNEAELMGELLFPWIPPGVTGTKLLAIIEFEIIYASPSGSVSCSLDISQDTFDTYLLDFYLLDIPLTLENGYYEFRREIVASTSIEPETLNLKSNGEWVTAYIEVPGYDPNDIDISTIRLDETIAVDPYAPTNIGDHDADGVSDLMVKFSRSEVIEYFEIVDYDGETGKSTWVNLTVAGEVAGTRFQGSDTIRLLET
ncbi:MAG: hypothetical protein PVH12_02050 [Candidatus Bathyarchaeota archaeon]